MVARVGSCDWLGRDKPGKLSCRLLDSLELDQFCKASPLETSFRSLPLLGQIYTVKDRAYIKMKHSSHGEVAPNPYKESFMILKWNHCRRKNLNTRDKPIWKELVWFPYLLLHTVDLRNISEWTSKFEDIDRQGWR